MPGGLRYDDPVYKWEQKMIDLIAKHPLASDEVKRFLYRAILCARYDHEDAGLELFFGRGASVALREQRKRIAEGV